MTLTDQDVIKLTGIVTAIQRGGIFEVKVQSGNEEKIVLARTSGKIKKFEIKIVLGDTVQVELSPYDLTRGRITLRAK